MTTLADLALAALIRIEIGGSLGVLLALTLRLPLRRIFGAELAYRLWALPPTIALIALLPTFADFFGPQPEQGADAVIPHSALLLQVWAGGLAIAVLAMALGDAAFRRLARQGRAGPAVMGVLWPRLVTPSDFAERFSPEERALIRRHECAHIRLGHPISNLAIAAAQAISWFNPIAYLGAAAAKLDQELACDASVICATPGARRQYGETLLKAHVNARTSLLACALSGLGRHPLETRLSALADQPVTLALYLRGAAAVALVGAIAAVCIWSAGPRWTTGPHLIWPTWTPAAAS